MMKFAQVPERSHARRTGPATRTTYQCKEVSSFKIFKKFTYILEDGTCDATAIIGKECYDQWVLSRKVRPKTPHEAFRRAVTAHIRGNDGRRPFSPEAEASLLGELRKKKQWDAFAGTDCLVGVKGFSSLGHHEKQQGAQQAKRKRVPAYVPKQVAPEMQVPELKKKKEDTDGSTANVQNKSQTHDFCNRYDPYNCKKEIDQHCAFIKDATMKKTSPRKFPPFGHPVPCDKLCCSSVPYNVEKSFEYEFDPDFNMFSSDFSNEDLYYDVNLLETTELDISSDADELDSIFDLEF